jgi:hypothetical protein
MSNLKEGQLKGLSDFLNMVAAAWFSAGVVSPLFANTESIIKTLFLSGIEISIAQFFLLRYTLCL